MSILLRMREVNQLVKDGDVALGDELQRLACLAIERGKTSPEWNAYMDHFAQGDTTRLGILNGNDVGFNNSPWAGRTLVYAVAGGCCGINTTCRVTRDMTPEMRSLLNV